MAISIQVVSPQASATGAADQGVTDLVQVGHTWWVVEPRGLKPPSGGIYGGAVEKGGAPAQPVGRGGGRGAG